MNNERIIILYKMGGTKMGRRNKRYLKLSIVAIALLLLSFFYYENNQRKIARLMESTLGTTTSEAIVATVDTKEQENAITEESTEAITESSTEVSKEKEAEERLTPQNMKEPMKVNGIIIVNKRYPLPESYDPGESKEAVAAFKRMNEEMRALGLKIAKEYSGYRSYSEQAALYQNYVADDGKSEAERYSSRPGYSEHQTGLAFDFIDTAGELVSSKAESDWIAENAHRYGFIVRYKEGQEDITGYIAESWHVRYIGEKDAAKIYEQNVTLEEYLGVEGGEYSEET
ncbi:M15 family metallopeptidase [Enterococcus sp. BWR-S5]|uniref:M15 family metallopeptidase n=1 Tax=Enterococcus sp. BWR-S5 TaxID=2787714 RepID=UPI0019213ECC|nr:M15 family metallopeptidase [Enterococcus sp. BWR-S5]MBL1223598.1 M15 family metallopeptidase [Enterococcus sp. BWR-S5]